MQSGFKFCTSYLLLDLLLFVQKNTLFVRRILNVLNVKRISLKYVLFPFVLMTGHKWLAIPLILRYKLISDNEIAKL